MSRNTLVLLGLLTGSVAMIGCSKNITAPSVDTDRQTQVLASQTVGGEEVMSEVENEMGQDKVELRIKRRPGIKQNGSWDDGSSEMDAKVAPAPGPEAVANGCGPAERSPENIQADVEAMEFELPEFKRNTEPASAGSKVGATGIDEGTVIYDLPEFKKNTEPASAAGKVGATGIDEGTVIYDLQEFKKNVQPAAAAKRPLPGNIQVDTEMEGFDLPEFKKNIEPAN